MPAATVTTSSAAVIPANGSRTMLVLQNNSDQDIYWRQNGAVSAAADGNLGLVLRKNGGSAVIGTLSGEGAPELAVYAMHTGSGNKVLTYEEYTG